MLCAVAEAVPQIHLLTIGAVASVLASQVMASVASSTAAKRLHFAILTALLERVAILGPRHETQTALNKLKVRASSMTGRSITGSINQPLLTFITLITGGLLCAGHFVVLAGYVQRLAIGALQAPSCQHHQHPVKAAATRPHQSLDC